MRTETQRIIDQHRFSLDEAFIPPMADEDEFDAGVEDVRGLDQWMNRKTNQQSSSVSDRTSSLPSPVSPIYANKPLPPPPRDLHRMVSVEAAMYEAGQKAYHEPPAVQKTYQEPPMILAELPDLNTKGGGWDGGAAGLPGSVGSLGIPQCRSCHEFAGLSDEPTSTMRLGKVITTIPTIGFNIEDIRRKEWVATLWDVGGCDRIRPLIEHYIDKDTFILFIHDCTDTERQDESILEMVFALERMIQKGAKHFWVLWNKQDALPPEKRENVVRNIKAAFEEAAEPYKNHCFFEVFGPPGLSGLTGNQTEAVLSRIKEVLLGQEHKSSKVDRDSQKTNAATKASWLPTTDELIKKINKLNEHAEDASTFWNKFLQADLRFWDHFTHLRAEYLVILETLSGGSSILDSADSFMAHLDRLRTAHPDRFRNTTHWFLQCASLKYAARRGSTGYSSPDDFHHVLLNSPELMHSGLWREYYSKDLLFTPDAKENWRLPDVKPLPAVAAIGQRKVDFRAHDTGTGDGHLRRPRAERCDCRSVVTGATVNNHTPKSVEPKGAPYSETQVYFWIQYFHAAVASIKDNISQPGNQNITNPDWKISLSSMTLETFKTLFGITGEEWKEYYSTSLWQSVPARMEYTNPDLKSLPNVMMVPSERNVTEARRKVLHGPGEKALGGSSDDDEFPDAASLSIMVAAALQEVSSLNGTSPTEVTSHAELLYELYRPLISNDSEQNNDVDDSNSDNLLRNERIWWGIQASMKLSGPGIRGVTQKMFWI
ncbi:ADP-ribosylation factor family-domain-containing protein [Xylariaceae sp. FL0255]|nr:ADP-ribosylation factor family-domain-containing protein [Xylariaceae sp. FL0255]